MKRRTVLTAPVVLLPIRALAEAPAGSAVRRYAVVSLIGDKMSIVVYQPQTGSSLDTNRHESVAMPDAVFDDAAVTAAAAAIKSARDAPAILMRVTSPTLYEHQNALVDDSRLKVPDDLAGAFKQAQATHLVLFTKYRAQANLKESGGSIGSGRLEGIGFYMDYQHKMRRSDTGEQGYGFLAPFVYIKASLFDLDTSRLIRESTVTASTTLSAARNEHGTDVWTTLSSDQKVQRLRSMITHEVTRLVPPLLAD